MATIFETRFTAGQAAAYRRAGYWTDTLLMDLVSQHAAANPERAALIEGDKILTYDRLLELTGRAAAAFLGLGVGRGDVVSVQLPNWSEFVVVMLALERIGAIINPLTPILRARELRTILNLGGSTVLIVPEAFRGFGHAAMARGLREDVPSLKRVVTVRGGRESGLLRWEDLVEDADASQHNLGAFRPLADDITELAFTSGTTGKPKGVLHTHNTALATVGSTIRRQRLTPADVFHVATPVGHNAGYFYGVRIALQAGGAAVFQPLWDAEEMCRLVEAHAVTFTMGSTTFLVDLLDCGQLEKRDLSALRAVTCGGAPIPEAVAREFERRLPGTLCPVFGMTEMGHATATGPDSPREKAMTTDGSAQPEMQLKVVSESGEPLPPGREGGLRFKGPFLFGGYVQGREFTQSFFDGDGYFDTGDLAYRDADGYIRITGRAKDIIIRGGENVPVREVEEVLAMHPKVAEGVVVGVSDRRLGERTVACVRLRDGCHTLTIDELRAHFAAAQVTRQFWPEDIVAFDELPATAAGKTRKAELREWLTRRGEA